jgi:hypothetical protein
MYTKSCLESPKGKYHSEYQDVDGRIVSKLILMKYGERVWTGLIWLGIGISFVLLSTLY